MRLRYQRHLLILEIGQGKLVLQSVKPTAAPITVHLDGQTHTLEGGETLERDLAAA